MIEEVNARKTAKNLLMGHICNGCAFSSERNSSLSPFAAGEIKTCYCTLVEETVLEETSCMFWISGEANENWYEFIKREGFLLEDIKKHWF